jgi:hypothetical protein
MCIFYKLEVLVPFSNNLYYIHNNENWLMRHSPTKTKDVYKYK